MLNVLHVIPNLSATSGGPTAVTLQTCRAMADLGVQSTIFTTNMATPAKAKSHKRITQHELEGSLDPRISIHFFEAKIPLSWCYSPSLARALKTECRNFDLIHIHSLNLHPQFAASRACISNQTPYVVSPHGALEPYLRSQRWIRKWVTDHVWQRHMLECATVIHTTSQREAELANALNLQTPVVIEPFGVDLSLFTEYGRAQWSRTLGQPPTILNHGRLDEKKGLDTLVHAMPKIQSVFPEARLVLIGSDDTGYGEYLDSLATTLGVAESIVRPGPLFGRDLASAVASADIWALPSKGENFGVAVAEAMAAGVPVVATRQVDLAFTASSSDAALISEDAPQSFADAILSVLTDTRLRSGLSARGASFSMKFDWRTVGPNMLDFYRSVAQC